MSQAMEALRELPEASHLALLSPRFMLRHPYGKKSDPISAFAFEEFTPEEGLRGMLWGHPALLAATVLASPNGSTLSVGDLPFHYVVDGDGDQVALPTTERLVNLAAAEMLRRVGIDALMAHKGQPELRIAGLDTVNGTAIAALPGMAKPASRMSFSTSLQGKMADPDDAPKGGAKKKKAATADDDDEADASSDDASSSDDSDSSSSDSSSEDSSLDDLLASLGDDNSGSDSSSEESSEEEAPPADAEMDPDLAELLKSLEG
jgi:type VI secretion system protein ImpC